MAGRLVERDALDVERRVLEGGDLVARREGDGGGDRDVDEAAGAVAPDGGVVDVQVAAEVDADPGRRHRAGGRRRRRPAHEAGLAEERDLVGMGGAEQVEAGIVREGEEPLAARPGAGGDVAPSSRAGTASAAPPRSSRRRCCRRSWPRRPDRGRRSAARRRWRRSTGARGRAPARRGRRRRSSAAPCRRPPSGSRSCGRRARRRRRTGSPSAGGPAGGRSRSPPSRRAPPRSRRSTSRG